MRAICMAILAFASAAGAAGRPFELVESFSRSRRGLPDPKRWKTTGFTWEVRDGRLICEDAGRVFAVLAASPHGRRVVVEATLTAEKALGRQWKVAGVAVYRDARNYWHLAMAESPADAARPLAHHWELMESLDGRWLANVEGDSALPAWGEPVEGTWKYGAAYRLRLELTPDGIRGTVSDESGRCVWRRGYRFAAGKAAVRAGRPALDCGDLRAAFDDVTVRVSEAAAPPASERPPKPPAYDRAPMSAIRRKGTGFFRVEQIDGTWWLIDPKGSAFYDVGTDHARYDGHWCQKLGYAPYGRNMRRKFPDESDWCAETASRLKAWGFTTVAAGHSPSLRHRGLIHTEFISFGARFAGYSDITPKVHWTGFPNVFHRRWEAYCRAYAEQYCRRQTDDPWLLGYFLDNELEWYGKSYGEFGLVAEAWAKPADHEAKRALVELLRKRRGTIAAANRAWGTACESFDALARSAEMPAAKSDAARADAYAYLALVAERYFGVAAKAIRSVDPNHMILGSRFAGRVHDVVWKVAGRHCDVVSCNYYGRVDLEAGTATPTKEALVGYHKLCRRPMMLTEWSHPALDSGLPCTRGAGQRFDTQAQRAEAFGVYQRMLFALPFMVGSHFFMWVDEPALGISDTFPENTNYGLVNERGQPYRELTSTAARLNPLAVAYHAGRTAEISVGIDAGARRVVLANRGKVPARCPVEIRQDGARRRRSLSIPPGGTIREPLANGTGGKVHFVVVRADPDRTLAEADRSDNAAAAHVFARAASPAGKRALIAVGNPTARALRNVAVRVPVARLLGGSGRGGAEVRPAGAGGRLPAQQVQPLGRGGNELVFVVPELGAYGSAVFEASTEAGAKPMRAEALAVPFEIANGPLKLRKTEADGDLIDDVSLDGLALGRVQALIHQNVGQDLWLAANRLVSVKRLAGPAETTLEFVAEYVPGRPAEAKTVVDDAGRYAARRRRGGGYRACYRLRVARGRPSFAVQFVSVTNIDPRPWRLEAYFHYLPGHVGGSSAGDGAAAGEVPNYYGLRTIWFDAKAGGGYGAIVPPPLEGNFWLDARGGQHPDIRREIGAVLPPGKTWQADEPAVRVFGVRGRVDDRPWRDAAGDLEARGRLLVAVRAAKRAAPAAARLAKPGGGSAVKQKTSPGDRPQPRAYTVPVIDLAAQTHRQVVVDREKGQYLGHPTTVLLEDRRTIVCVYPKGHGRGAIVMKRSTDGGRTWSRRLPTPKSWETSKETPTIHRVVDAAGTRRLILFSGLYPIRMSVSTDDANTWSELKPIGEFGGIVAMGDVVKLKQPGRHLAMFHDDGRFFRKGGRRTKTMRLYSTLSTDGGLTWGEPQEIFARSDVHLCEPGSIRSPDGRQIAVLMRENARRRNSYVMFSDDEGATWSQPRELPASLTGDRHTLRYAPDGRVVATFRDTAHESPTKGDWVAWVGTYRDIAERREGQYRVRLMDNHHGWDCAYPGLELLPNGTFVATTYGHWTQGEKPYVVSVRFKLEEIDALAPRRR